MTNREREVLKCLQENPLVSQNDLAAKLNIARSSVAVHIANLMKKGIIKGKGYIIADNHFVSMIGACNIDVAGIPFTKLIDKDSNPGRVSFSMGGVSRNIAENLRRLDINVELLTIFADDVYGELLKKNCLDLGIEIGNSLSIPNTTTATYVYIADSDKDMRLAISDMEIYKNITPSLLESRKESLEQSKVIVIDTCLELETIEYLLSNINVPVFIDLVSVSRGMKVKEIIGKFHTIKPNRYEAEVLSDIKINNEKDLITASDFFIEKGVKQVFISLGSNGVYYNNGIEKGLLPPYKSEIVNTTGAGDSFMAGIVYGFLNDCSILDSAKIASAAASVCVSSIETISKTLSYDKIEKIMNDNLLQTSKLKF
jgi:pseudouridine kinase